MREKSILRSPVKVRLDEEKLRPWEVYQGRLALFGKSEAPIDHFSLGELQTSITDLSADPTTVGMVFIEPSQAQRLWTDGDLGIDHLVRASVQHLMIVIPKFLSPSWSLVVGLVFPEGRKVLDLDTNDRVWYQIFEGDDLQPVL